jgi:enoyl-CoA hydratase/carnithine racemase
MSYQDLIVEHRSAATWLYLNRPKVLNAISISCMRELIAVLTELRGRETTRVVVFSGKGRAFCAGVDIGEFSKGGGFTDIGVEFERLVTTMPKPVIAALNGITCGGGLELAMMCDFMIAAESARIGDAHANFGLIPGGGASLRLPRIVGVNWARYLMYTGDLFPAREMAAIGLVTRVVADNDLETEVQALAEKLSAKSPLGLERMKALINDGMDVPADVALAAERAMFGEHLTSFDAQEGGKAFAEKRKPRFRGV